MKMKFMNMIKKYGPKIAAGASAAAFTGFAYAAPLLNGTTDPVTTKQADVQADIGVVAGVLLSIAVTIFGIRKVIGTIRG